jgi:tetratricopeptide (TPR) repeat protein
MRALQIDDRVAEAHASLGYEQTFFEWDWEAAAQSQQRAIQLNPQYPSAHQWMGWVHFAAGDYEAALEKLRTAIDLDPLSPIINVHWGLALTNAGDPDAAIQQFRQTAEMLPEFALNYVGWGWSLLRAGRAAAAIEPLERARELSQGRFGMGFLGVAYALDGQPASASALLESMEAAARTTYVSAAERAMIHGAMGDLDGCFSLLQTAVEDRAPDLVRLWFDPWADSVRADPRFDEISNLAGLR